VNNLIGTSCSIGDVNFGFLNASEDSFVGISASAISFAPDGSNPLAPSFTLTGPFTETANSSNSGFANQEFNFFWNLSVTNSLFQINSSTATIFDASLPNSPDFGFLNAGNNLGFSNAILQTGGPNTNPSTVAIPASVLNLPDGFFGAVSATAIPGDVATTSAGSMELQYQLVPVSVPVPEPPSRSLISVAMLAAVAVSLLRRSVA